MDNIYSVIDVGKLGLDIERMKVKVSAENIANVANETFVKQKVDFVKILQAFDDALSGESVDSNSIEKIRSNESASVGEAINLDQEIVDINNAEMRYKVIAQVIQKKFGLLELAMNGGKK